MRRGSALLIVLGMLSFMLFSGLAFSIYMRQARLPSSFIRRTAMTRQLAKAALSEAMAEINHSIGNDPHPGIFNPGSTQNQQSGNNNKSNTYSYNTFYRRIFLGTGVDKGQYENNRESALRGLLLDNMSDDVKKQTVSTLTLEGLAFLPPCLINEARVYSRRTPTAKWAPFAFEAGRYAYTAIDVSDFFDINRVPVNAHRSSASSTRITLSHVFEDGEHTASGGSQGKTYETQANSKQAEQYPFISLADWNLAMAKTKIGSEYSPVMDFLSGSQQEPCAITAAEDEEDPKVSAYRSMTFVTDSLFAKSSTTTSSGSGTQSQSADIDLEDSENQPFTATELKSGTYAGVNQLCMKIEAESGNQGDPKHPFFRFLGHMGMCALYDYLDEDSVPLSLAIPSVERNPMICAINPLVQDSEIKFDVKPGAARDPVTKQPIPTDGTGPAAPTNSRDVEREDLYMIDGQGLFRPMVASLSVEALYPFVRGKSFSKSDYALDGKVAVYFTCRGDDIPLNSAGSNNGLLLPGGTISDGKDDEPSDGVLSATFSGWTFSAESVQNDKTKLIGFDGHSASHPIQSFTQLGSAFNTTPGSGKYFIKMTRKWTQHVTIDPVTGDRTWPDGTEDPGTNPNTIDAVDFRMPVLYGRSNPQKTAQAYTSADLLTLVRNNGTIKLNFAFWVRMRNTKEKFNGRDAVCDLVPASVEDDGRQFSVQSGVWASRLADLYGKGPQLLQFSVDANGDVPLAPWNITAGLTKPVHFEVAPIMVADPRYNHSPLNWFSDPNSTGNVQLEQLWLANCNCNGVGRNSESRDADCLMAVSDQGYLQSVFELAHLPRLSLPLLDGGETKPGVDARLGGLWNSANSTQTKIYSQFGDTLNSDVMWMTYNPFKISPNCRIDPFEELIDEYQIVSGTKGQKVNPFSDSPAVISAAFANTPIDWRAASTNYTCKGSIGSGYTLSNVNAFNNQYAWNEYNGSATIPWFDTDSDVGGVLKLAKDFMSEMRTCYDADQWVDVYNDLWDGSATDSTKLMNSKIDGGPFYSVDKKFLYGFWHDCFAVQQQLFLIFVRAEPMMMGGGVAGVAPPQLASRAVALVWRDPRPTAIDSDTNRPKPHAMRVLFYHPLD